MGPGPLPRCFPLSAADKAAPCSELGRGRGGSCALFLAPACRMQRMGMCCLRLCMRLRLCGCVSVCPQHLDNEKVAGVLLQMLNKMHALKHPRVFASHGMLSVLIALSEKYEDNTEVRRPAMAGEVLPPHPHPRVGFHALPHSVAVRMGVRVFWGGEGRGRNVGVCVGGGGRSGASPRRPAV
jgi:hypothetical protein